LALSMGQTLKERQLGVINSTGPKSKDFNNTKILENNGLWGVQNAKKSAFRNYTWLGS
jgi:hypothetical protein